jgi:hypothetical protein
MVSPLTIILKGSNSDEKVDALIIKDLVLSDFDLLGKLKTQLIWDQFDDPRDCNCTMQRSVKDISVIIADDARAICLGMIINSAIIRTTLRQSGPLSRRLSYS